MFNCIEGRSIQIICGARSNDMYMKYISMEPGISIFFQIMVRLRQQDVVPSVEGVLNDGVIKVRDALIKIFHQGRNNSMLLVNIRRISVRRKTELEITRNRSVHADGPL